MTIEDYIISEKEIFGETIKILFNSINGSFIPWMCWKNQDWCEYAKLAGIENE